MEEWELSKENVLPQKKGRDIQLLNSALQSNAAQVEEQRRRLMLDIESYAGEDPLQPWLKIIKWAKQTYPTGGSQSPILSLLESCARKFKSDERYKSDKRYLTVWVQYADCCSDPSDIFAFLEANEIGQEHALYYEACATFFESRRNFSRANDIYELGVARQAQPLGRLQNMYKGFLERMNRRHKRQLREEQERRGSFDEQGQPRAFGQKLTGRGPARPFQQPGRQMPQRSPLQRVNNAALHVFVDAEFGGSSSRQGATASHSAWQNLAPDAERRKENLQRPMKWTDAKIPTQSNPTSQPSLDIFVDEEFVRSKEQARAVSPHIPATLKLRHDDVGRRRELTLKSKPLQRFSEASPSVGQTNQQLTVEDYGYNFSVVSENGLERSFEEFRAMKWQQARKHPSQLSRLSPASLQPAEPSSRGAAVLDWLNKSPVIMLPDSAHQDVRGGLTDSSKVGEQGVKDVRSAEELTLRDDRILNAYEARRERVPIVCENGEKVTGGETMFPTNGEETIAIRRIAQQAIIMGVDPEIGNMAVHHPGLVEPTINTKEAMDDINSMFQSDLPCERKRRSDGSSRGIKKVTPIGDGTFPRDSKQRFQVYMDEDLEEQKPSQSSKVGTHSDGEAVTKALELGADTTESNGKDRKQGFQVYVDEPVVTQIRTHKRSSVPVHTPEELRRTLNTGDGTAGFKVAGRRESFQVYLDGEFGGLKSVQCGQKVVETKPSTISVYGGEGLPRRLKYGEDTVDFKTESSVQSFPIYMDEELIAPVSKPEFIGIGMSESKKAPKLTGRKPGFAGYVYGESGEHNSVVFNRNVLANTSDGTQVPVLEEAATSLGFQPEPADTVVHSSALAFEQDVKAQRTLQVYQDENHYDPSVNFASSLASLALHSDKENRSTCPPNLTSDGRMSTGGGITTSAHVKCLNPWDEALLVRLLNGLDPPLSECEGYHLSNTKYPGAPLSSIRKAPRGKTVELSGRAYYIKSCTGQGAFAQVYLADDYEGDDEVVLKVQKPSWPWEFYIYSELHKRIPLKERASYGHALRMHCYSDYSIMVCKYGEHGTLQDVINAYLAKGEKMDEVLCIYYTIEMLRMLENLHAAGLIHGDFKPDNLLIRKHSERFQNWSPERPGCWQHEGLSLIDWGRSVDLSLFPPGTQFLADCKTEGFQCIEMLEERPWTFQIDTYGLCVVVHCLLHGDYLEVKRVSDISSSSPKYQPRAAYKRYWNAELWRNLFDTLLNIDSCHTHPPLGPLRKSFEDYLLSNPGLVSKLSHLLMRQNILMSKR